MIELRRLLARAATSTSTVLLTGETGTGKEVSASAIHEASERRNGPFIVVDCGAIPAMLLESELFGYERGAFTGAVKPRAGAFEAAHGGTIFLDEIGELPLELQPKILRALESRKVKRIGSNDYRPLDVHVIAATHRDLEHEVQAKRFREDLFYRLAVLRIRLPPLRERPGDLVLLVQDMLTQLGKRQSPEAQELLRPASLEALARHRWPGNVRQLRNYVEAFVALGEAPLPPDREPSSLPPAATSSEPPQATTTDLDFDLPLREAREQWSRLLEAKYLARILERHNNSVTKAARAAQVNRVHFYRLLWRHGLKTQHEGPLETDNQP